MSSFSFLHRLLAAVLAAAPLLAAATPILPLTFLPDGFTAHALNRAGQVAGTGRGGAAIWSPSGTLWLGATLPGSEGLAINNAGAIAGEVQGQPFAYGRGVVVYPGSGLYYAWATGINDGGVLIGGSLGDPISQRAWIGHPGNQQFIPAPGGQFSVARALNNAGQVAGFGTYDDADYGNTLRQALLYQDGVSTALGTLGGSNSEANDLNEAGQVVGWSQLAGDLVERPFLYAGGQMTDLGSLGGRSARANAINNLGMVVGMAALGAAGDGLDYHAFLYRDGAMLDLNGLIDPAPGWTLVSALDINDAQQVLAQACSTNAAGCRPVLLDLVSCVPEPAGWMLLLLGLPLTLIRRRRAALALLALAAAPAAVLAEPLYHASFLPAGFWAGDMNQRGQVVGTLDNGYGAAAVWDGSIQWTLAALAPASAGLAINDRGDIAGAAGFGSMLYAGGALHDINREGQWMTSRATALNNSGAVAGDASYLVGERERGFVYHDGVLRMIPTFGGDWSEVQAINSARQVVGTAAMSGFGPGPYSPPRRAYLFQDGIMHDLGTLGGWASEGADINELGQVVGGSALTADIESPVWRAFLYQDGVMTALGTLGGDSARATGINNLGLIVGDSTLADSSSLPHAFLYQQGALRDLNDLVAGLDGWTLVGAADINDAGQILASACSDTECRTLRLDLVSAVPEPAPLLLLTGGLALLAGRRRAAARGALFR